MRPFCSALTRIAGAIRRALMMRRELRSSEASRDECLCVRALCCATPARDATLTCQSTCVQSQAAITELERIDNFDCSVLIKSCVSSLHFMRSQS